MGAHPAMLAQALRLAETDIRTGEEVVRGRDKEAGGRLDGCPGRRPPLRPHPTGPYGPLYLPPVPSIVGSLGRAEGPRVVAAATLAFLDATPAARTR
ncbi:hypothetical protein [Streptomyces acidiscabies]|uniref:hypothetical protein n=1 Tax=Streptomyces acidiscabies TaxID=42234 RepID=UPI0018FEADCA|nr:hypothetical protein [Streptomyces acidiscabies]